MRIVVTADGSKTLFSEEYNQTFHSDRGALAESKHVFLETSAVADRLRRGLPTTVLEVGFGTGFNFFLTADLALQHNARLSYVALEQNLLSSSIISSLSYTDYLVNKELMAAFLEFRKTSDLQKSLIFEFASVGLELKLGNALNQKLPNQYFDAIYQDAFSPEENPELWSKDFLISLKHSLKPSGKLTTYSVKGEVRRKMTEIGFKVQKLAGPVGGKREILLSTLV